MDFQRHIDYTWELGIDWLAIPTAGLRYLRHGLVKNKLDGTRAMAPLFLCEGETVGFNIFDVSPAQADATAKIKSFSIIIRNSDFPIIGAGGVLGSPFERLQLTFERQGAKTSVAFATDTQQAFPAWTPVKMAQVSSQAAPLEDPSGDDFLTVTTPGRYLVSFLLQADMSVALEPGQPTQIANYIFAVDPEMIIGEHG
jgi:hypothetical protein